MNMKRPGIFWALTVVLFFGCALHQPVVPDDPDAKRITDVQLTKSAEYLIFTIKANQSLTWTVEELDYPMGLVLQFPDTNLETGRGVYTPPSNEIVSSVKAHQFFENNTIRTRIFFALKTVAPYVLTEENSNKAKALKKPAAKKQPAKDIQKGLRAANQLKSIKATPLENHIEVEVNADRVLDNYKSFTIENPDRIVFDMYNLKSPFEQEQIIRVESKWVKRVRHFGHPDRVRLVIETHKSYLKNYATLSTDTGLLIQVGKIPASSNQTHQTDSDARPATGQATLTWDDVPGATAYNVYWRASPGVNSKNGNKISNIKTPQTTIEGLRPGATYYFVVTTVEGTAESRESEEVSFTVGR